MEKYKKYSAVAGAVALVACWPLVLGQIGQKVAENYVANAHNPAYDVKIVNYDRGYLSSDVEFQVIIKSSNVKNHLTTGHLPTEFLFHSHLVHGPLAVSGVTTLDNSTLPVVIKSDTQLNGNTKLHAQIGKVEFKESNTEFSYHLPVSTVDANVGVNGSVSYQIQVPEFSSTSSDGTQLNLKSLSVTGQGEKSQQFWLGSNELNINNVTLSDASQANNLSMDGIHYSLTSDVDEKKVNFSSDHLLTVQKLSNGKDNIENGELAVKIGGLDVDSLEKLAALSNTMKAGDAESIEATRQHMMELINHIIEKGLYLNVDKLGFRYLDGQMKNKLQLSLPPETESGKVDLGSIIHHLQGNAFSVVDKSLASEFPNLQETLDELVIMEMAEDSEKSYQLNATIKDGNVLFPNGKKIPIIRLLFPLFVQ